MRILVAILFNTALFALLLLWLRRQWQWAVLRWWRVALVAGLGLRVAVGLALSWNPKLDAEFMVNSSHILTKLIWQDPAAALRMFTGSVTHFWIGTPLGGAPAVFQNTSNTWVMIKLLALLNLGSLGTAWVNGFYLSVFACMGCWQLALRLAELFPATPPGAGVVAFLLWPSNWFWATGISKEAVLLGSGAWLTAHVLGGLYGPATGPAKPRFGWVGWWVVLGTLAALHFYLRYFFALPLLGVLGGLMLGQWLARAVPARRHWVRAAALVAVLAGGIWLAPQLSKAFSINKFTNQVIRVYTFELAHSVGKPHFEYPDLRPTVASIAAHAPQAVLNVFTRPWLGESWQPRYVAAGLENAGLLLLAGLALVATLRGRAGHLPFELGLGLVVLCGVLAVLIGLTTPNLGSLSRYRSEVMPFLVLLLLQNGDAAALLRRLGLGRNPHGVGRT